MGARGLNVEHNVVDISVVRSGGDIGALYDHLEHDHGWKQTDVITGSELLMLHFQTHHEAVVAGEHMLGRHDVTLQLECQECARTFSTIKDAYKHLEDDEECGRAQGRFTVVEVH